MDWADRTDKRLETIEERYHMLSVLVHRLARQMHHGERHEGQFEQCPNNLCQMAMATMEEEIR